ncbi:MAG: shikimate dehydrogenase [Flavobacteriales bacterium]|nr:shikimate dehydrogenase [Flavobacteriales bacterium]MBK6945349.1 shikimate dehydrogenase [Flavobacteriales bacterium]MBK7241462.1 shikimate dehydrogenase [Flavobacteriales bacterium]MBK7298499.1 shikimate dehydrogenase [Flavobacteriales bacterium]MBK9535093.1 shikimate dehydrogenase [Flavobacteriales bacterium]
MIRYGLIGRSLKHSWSQEFFTKKFHKEGLSDHHYDPFELEDIEDLELLLSETKDLKGLNVTLPYKQTVMPLLDAIDPMAAAVGAVNTITIRNGRTTGYNTDVEGFRSTLLPLLDGEKPRALVLGTGGASRAVAFVLRECGVKFRSVSRNRERGDLTWDLLEPAIIKACTLIVNTTPLGMYPNVSEMPVLPYSAVGPRHLLIDLVYNPPYTQFLQKGQANGARISNGSTMLRAQAEASWRIWNN